MKRLLLAIALVATATSVIQAAYNSDELQEQSSCSRCARRAPRCRSCEGSRWHPFRGSCERCMMGCDRTA